MRWLAPALALSIATFEAPALAEEARHEDASVVGSATNAPFPETLSPFYRELVEPGRRRAMAHLQLAREALDGTYGGTIGSPRAAEHIVTRLRLAHLHAPGDEEILFQLALALTSTLPDRRRAGFDRRVEEATDAWTRLRALSPRYEPFIVGTELALLQTRRRDFRAAMQEYERAIPEALSESSLGTIYANYAEVSMGAGDLVGAVERYERALTLETRVGQSSSSLALISFGLAVALDRLGESESALIRAHQAVMAAGGDLELLSSPHVFFEPSEEVNYYLMLGELALARHASSANERATHLSLALTHGRRFLEGGGAQGQFAAQAQRRVESIELEQRERRASSAPPTAQRRPRARR